MGTLVNRLICFAVIALSAGCEARSYYDKYQRVMDAKDNVLEQTKKELEQAKKKAAEAQEVAENAKGALTAEQKALGRIFNE